VAGAQTAALRISELPALMLRDLDGVAKDPNVQGAEFTALRANLAAFTDAAKALDAKMSAAEQNGDLSTMDALAAKVAASRDAFYVPEGLSYNRYWHTLDRFVRPFPEVNYASYETDGRAEKMKAAIDRLTAAVEKATSALR
jgi:hypothetical protein